MTLKYLPACTSVRVQNGKILCLTKINIYNILDYSDVPSKEKAPFLKVNLNSGLPTPYLIHYGKST